MYDEKTICEIVREMELNDESGTTTISKYVQVNPREDIDTTEAYLNSKHISGSTDSKGRPKPFFNIVISARNIHYRATDLDRKNISLIPKNEKQVIPALLATIKLQEWMKKAHFGSFLNKWGLVLAGHNAAICEFIEKDGKLECSVLDWNNILFDAVDFEHNLLVKKMWFTAAQLRKNKSYNQDFVKQIIKSPEARETIDGQKKDNKQDYFLVYEVHGEMPLSYLTDEDKDDETYVQQMHAVCFQKSNENSGYNDYTLFKGRSKKAHILTHLIDSEGQTYPGGVVKNLFDAQWMVNHSQKQMKDQLDLTSKIFFQTEDGDFVGQNALTNLDNGQILVHGQGKPLTPLNNRSDIGAIQSFKADWQNIANQINNISESLRGNTAPSGTAWRQVEALLQESHSLFDLMTQNKGLYLERILREFVIPYFKKQLDTTEEISAILDDNMIKKIDSMYLPSEVERRLNNKKKNVILSGEIYDPTQEPLDRMSIEQAVKGELKGNQRFIKPSDVPSVTWKKLFEDLEWDIDINITGEAKDIQGTLATLSSVLQTIASNPAVLQDPNVKLVFSKILSLTNAISPLELQGADQQPQMQLNQSPMLQGAQL